MREQLVLAERKTKAPDKSPKDLLGSFAGCKLNQTVGVFSHVLSSPLIESELPFDKAKIAWTDIEYTVYIGKKKKEAKKLLHKVSGAAVPGRLTALMGASG